MERTEYLANLSLATRTQPLWTQPSRIQRPRAPKPACRIRFVIALAIAAAMVIVL